MKTGHKAIHKPGYGNYQNFPFSVTPKPWQCSMPAAVLLTPECLTKGQKDLTLAQPTARL